MCQFLLLSHQPNWKMFLRPNISARHYTVVLISVIQAAIAPTCSTLCMTFYPLTFFCSTQKRRWKVVRIHTWSLGTSLHWTSSPLPTRSPPEWCFLSFCLCSSHIHSVLDSFMHSKVIVCCFFHCHRSIFPASALSIVTWPAEMFSLVRARHWRSLTLACPGRQRRCMCRVPKDVCLWSGWPLSL